MTTLYRAPKTLPKVTPSTPSTEADYRSEEEAKRFADPEIHGKPGERTAAQHRREVASLVERHDREIERLRGFLSDQQARIDRLTGDLAESETRTRNAMKSQLEARVNESGATSRSRAFWAQGVFATVVASGGGGVLSQFGSTKPGLYIGWSMIAFALLFSFVPRLIDRFIPNRK